MKKIYILGAGGHGKVVADIARLNGYDQISFLDDHPASSTCDGYPIVGKIQDFPHMNGDFFVAIGNARVRQIFMDKLKAAGKTIPLLIHPDAVIAGTASVGEGTVIMAGAVVNPAAVIGRGCIINTCSSVDHDCFIEDYVHVSVGAHVAGTVRVGTRTWLGGGCTISNNLSICPDCMIGAGALVIGNITEAGTYVGLPAKKKTNR